MKEEEAYSILDIISESDGQSVILTRAAAYVSRSSSGSRSAIPFPRKTSTKGTGCTGKPSGTCPTVPTYTNRMYSLKRVPPGQRHRLFLDRADARHFEGRLYIDHTCILHFVLAGLKSSGEGVCILTPGL
ncbi:hypothetical protein NXV14_14625 [Bacteroides fragilis]|nr:hypothetical protein [Bacteroides fragilis]